MLADVLVVGVVAALVALAIRSLWKGRHDGSCSSCSSGSSTSCEGCSAVPDVSSSRIDQEKLEQVRRKHGVS